MISDLGNDRGETRRQRIDRLLSEGILSARQAELLRESLQPSAPGTPAAERKRPSGSPGTWIGWAVLALVLVGSVLALVGAGGPEPGSVQNVAETINQPGVIGAMNRPLSIFLAVTILLVVPLVIWIWLHNSIVGKEEAVYETWAQVDSNYQRRSDLIPALVETASRYLRHESDTLTSVTRERALAVNPLSQTLDELAEAQKVSTDLLRTHGAKLIEDERGLAALGQAQQLVGTQMRRILGLVESYPALRSSDQFLELQGQLEGTENRINLARVRFNEAVRNYNRAIRYLPGSLVAAAGNFRRKAYFDAVEGSERAPALGFN